MEKHSNRISTAAHQKTRLDNGGGNPHSKLATMAFQALVSPPGGLWQDDLTEDSPVLNTHHAGESIMSYRDTKYFRNFILGNTIAFVSSLSIILFLIGGLPFKHRFFIWCLIVAMSLTVTSIAVTYGITILAITPKIYRHSPSHVVEIAITVLCAVMGILLVGSDLVRLIAIWLKRRGAVRRPLERFRNSVEVGVEHDRDGRGESV